MEIANTQRLTKYDWTPLYIGASNGVSFPLKVKVFRKYILMFSQNKDYWTFVWKFIDNYHSAKIVSKHLS